MAYSDIKINSFSESNISHLFVPTERPNLHKAINHFYFQKIKSQIGRPMKASVAESYGAGAIRQSRNAFLMGSEKTINNAYALIMGQHVLKIGLKLGGLANLQGLDLAHASPELQKNKDLADLVTIIQATHESLRLTTDIESVRQSMEAIIMQRMPVTPDLKTTGDYANPLLEGFNYKSFDSTLYLTRLRMLFLMADKVTDQLTWIAQANADSIKKAYKEFQQLGLRLANSNFGPNGVSVINGIDPGTEPTLCSFIATPGTDHLAEEHEFDSLTDSFNVMIAAAVSSPSFCRTKLAAYLQLISIDDNASLYPEAFRLGSRSNAVTITQPAHDHFLDAILGSAFTDLTAVDLLHTANLLESGITSGSSSHALNSLVPPGYSNDLAVRSSAAYSLYELFFDWYKYEQFALKGDQKINQAHPVVSHNQTTPPGSGSFTEQLDSASSVFNKLLIAHQLSVDTLRAFGKMILPATVPNHRSTGWRAPYRDTEYSKGIEWLAKSLNEEIPLKGFLMDPLESNILCLPIGNGYSPDDELMFTSLRPLRVDTDPNLYDTKPVQDDQRSVDKDKDSRNRDDTSIIKTNVSSSNQGDPKQRSALKDYGLLIPFSLTEVALYIANYGRHMESKALVRDNDRLEFATMGSIGNVEYNRGLVSSAYTLGNVSVVSASALDFNINPVYRRLNIEMFAPQFKDSTRKLEVDPSIIQKLVDKLNYSTDFNTAASRRQHRVVVGVDRASVEHLTLFISKSMSPVAHVMPLMIVFPEDEIIRSSRKLEAHQLSFYDMLWQQGTGVGVNTIIVDKFLDGSDVKTSIPDVLAKALVETDQHATHFALNYLLDAKNNSNPNSKWERYEKTMLERLHMRKDDNVTLYYRDMSPHHLFTLEAGRVVGDIPNLRRGMPVEVPGYVDLAHCINFVESIEVPETRIDGVIRPRVLDGAFTRYLEGKVSVKDKFLMHAVYNVAYEEYAIPIVDRNIEIISTESLTSVLPFMSESYLGDLEKDADSRKASFSVAMDALKPNNSVTSKGLANNNQGGSAAPNKSSDSDNQKKKWEGKKNFNKGGVKDKPSTTSETTETDE